MFALWCVPVDQNPKKSVLTTLVIGMLLTGEKRNQTQNITECSVEVTDNLLILAVWFMTIMDFIKPVTWCILSL